VTLRARWGAAGAVAALTGAVAAVSLLSTAGGGAPVPSVTGRPASPDGVPALGFVPPDAGSYRLERILRTPDGAVLDSDGSEHRLRDFTTGRITLFSFIYTYCTDPQGCPLAYATLHALKDMIAADPALRGKVRFVSMSFDPAFDTPAMMRSYGDVDALPGNALPWHFLTTASHAALAPLLAGFGQDVTVITGGQPAQRAPVLAHLLKVYLIDPDGMVREIYSPAYLHPRILRNDIVTLLLELRAGQP
jgi:protein SCO1/2